MDHKRIAMIFPGQGSQSIGMGKSFYENSSVAREMFEKAGERIGVDLENYCLKKMTSLIKHSLHSQLFY